MWKNFEGIARTREQTLERINALQWPDWRPQGITLHNTAEPSLAQWAETGAAHDARIRNLQSFYEHEQGWHAGPHWFVSRNWINWFSNPLQSGIHSRCFNATRFGIEMVGDYNKEEFNSGDGAMVRDNAVFLIAALNLKFNFDPGDLTFHVECKKDNHDCPGKKVVKADVISRVREMMATLRSGPAISVRPRMPAASASAGASRRLLNITATEFGGEGDEQPVAYADVSDGWPNRPGVALPCRFSGPRPKVRVYKGDRSILCDIVDVGPWYPSARGPEDKYWETGARPRAESDDRTNRAGIDLTPAAAAAIDLDGKGIVDWEFSGAVPAVREVERPSGAERSMQFSLLGRLMQRLDRIEDAITQNARRMDRGVLPPADSTGPTPTLMPGPDDISTLLERLLPLIEKLQGPRAPTAIPADLQQPEQLRKALDLIKTILVPGADGKPPPLGQVNGALGQTIGNLLNGKKTAIGLLGAVITPMLTQASATTALGPILAMLTPAAGLAPFTLPIFLGLTAWGVLGKMEKWSHGTAPPPRSLT
jgi:N-acetylmuramoyl-L-alanine amidase